MCLARAIIGHSQSCLRTCVCLHVCMCVSVLIDLPGSKHGCRKASWYESRAQAQEHPPVRVLLLGGGLITCTRTHVRELLCVVRPWAPGFVLVLRVCRNSVMRWAQKSYRKSNLGTYLKCSPFEGSSHAKGIVLEKMYVPGALVCRWGLVSVCCLPFYCHGLGVSGRCQLSCFCHPEAVSLLDSN